MDSYKDTYFSLCLPKVTPTLLSHLNFWIDLIWYDIIYHVNRLLQTQIVGPMIRLSLLTWNPLERDCKALEKMEWYETLMKYGFKSDETEAQLVDDPDIRLIPSIVEKIILPKITGSSLGSRGLLIQHHNGFGLFVWLFSHRIYWKVLGSTVINTNTEFSHTDPSNGWTLSVVETDIQIHEKPIYRDLRPNEIIAGKWCFHTDFPEAVSHNRFLFFRVLFLQYACDISSFILFYRTFLYQAPRGQNVIFPATIQQCIEIISKFFELGGDFIGLSPQRNCHIISTQSIFVVSDTGKIGACISEQFERTITKTKVKACSSFWIEWIFGSSRYAIQQMRPPNRILLSIRCHVFGCNRVQSLPAWIYLYNFCDRWLPNWTNGIRCICTFSQIQKEIIPSQKNDFLTKKFRLFFLTYLQRSGRKNWANIWNISLANDTVYLVDSLSP